MFFSQVARVVAVLALIGGAIQVLMGVGIANEWGGISAANLGRYTTAATTGELIDRGIYKILFAVALGTWPRSDLRSEGIGGSSTSLRWQPSYETPCSRSRGTSMSRRPPRSAS